MASSSATATLPLLRVGMIGGGTVGGGVYNIIMNGEHHSSSLLEKQVCITKLCVRDLGKKRDFEVDAGKTKITDNVRDVIDDPEIDLVIEVMGGTGLAKTVVIDSLMAKKGVVTANKALLAEHLDELDEIQQASQAPFAYEAAVCGGIPIIHVLSSGCFAGDTIQDVSGIMNGTTNFMLCAMVKGANYAEILKEAQDLGYAEADPTADVEGHDVRAKIALLAKLAFHQSVPVDQIPCKGISSVVLDDFSLAQQLGCTIKLIGTAKVDENDMLSVHVSPKLVPTSHLFGPADGSGNIVAVTSTNLAQTSFSGPGAGRYETANSIVADVYRIASGLHTKQPFGAPSAKARTIVPQYSSAFYVRVPSGASGSIGSLAGTHNIEVEKELTATGASAAFVTKPTSLAKVEALCADVDGDAICMPFV